MNDPLISVLLPVYNADPYLDAAMASILQQSLADFELIVLDDASSDGSSEIISSQSNADCRIRHIRSDQNLGLSAQLNGGILLSRGQFIARMDADDIAMSTRFAEQVKVFENMPEVGICGSIVEEFTDSGINCIWDLPEHSNDISCFQFLQCGFNHPSVMIRSSVLSDSDLKYREDFVVAQDYELWHRILKVTSGYNIQSKLLRYRRFPGQLSQARSERKDEEAEQIRLAMRQDLGLPDDPSMAAMHRTVASGEWPQDVNQFKKIVAWLNCVYEANALSNTFPHHEFGVMLASRLYIQCHMAARRGFDALAIFGSAVFAESTQISLLERIRTSLKAQLRRSKEMSSLK